MTNRTNPWFQITETVLDPIEDAAGLPMTTGATAPQQAVTPPEAADQLGVFTPMEAALLWVVGAHGGAGESALAELLHASTTNHRWPRRPDPAPVLLAARTHARGLSAAQLAMRAWASGQTPAVQLLGLVLVADAPGRLPKQLEQRALVLGGGVPHVWRLPWVENYRLGHLDPSENRHVRKILTEINAALSTARLH